MADDAVAARVTVVIPCHDDGALLRDALASVEEAEPVNVVVVDDASSDAATKAILESLGESGHTVLRHDENRGPSAARNTGLASASTPYVFPLDADDLAVAGALAAMADRLDADPALAVCYGDYLEFGDHELLRAVPDRLDGFRIAYANEYPISSLLRRTVLEEVGGWQHVGYEDWDLWMALAESGRRGLHLGHGRPTFKKRIHGARRLAADKRRHADLYRTLRGRHPALFSDLPRLRRDSDLPRRRKLLYPIVYGGRRRFGIERRVKRLLDRSRVWTLRR